MASWNSAQYLKFKAERTQPSIDLANRIPLSSPADVLDVGCGPGNSTDILRRKFPGARILGIDSSDAMIEAARAACPTLEFRLCDASRELPALGRQFDVVFSNACLQWIPDHPALLDAMWALLRPGGVLAVQVPLNENEPVHRLLKKLATSAPWKDRHMQPRIFHTLPPKRYCELLARLTADYTVWQTTYYHRLASHAEILEWYRGSGLRPYLEALEKKEDKAAFEAEVYKGVVEAYPPLENGEILFPFPRFFFLAVR